MSQTIKQQRAVSLVKDWHTQQRKDFINPETKLEQAINFLGEKWVLHPNNSPKRGNYTERGYVK